VQQRGPLPVAQACDLARQAALGLQHAHESGMVHRDVKPHNLMLTPSGQVKILDFGLAHLSDERSATATPLSSGTVLGTPDYLAPEQAREPAGADSRADLYSLGCTLYHFLTGHPPFPGGTVLQKLLAHQECRPRALTAERAEVPEALAAVVQRLLAKDPAQRYPTAAGVAADLERFLHPLPAPPVPPPRRSARRRWFVATGTLAVGTLALAGYWMRAAWLPQTRSDDGGASLPRAAEPAPARLPVPDEARGPAAIATAEAVARQKREVRDRAVDWLRANNRWQPDHPMPADVASNINRDLEASEVFLVMLGPGLLKSAKATLLVGRAGALDVLELDGELARDFPAGEHGCRVRNCSTGSDRRRATPRVLLSGAVLEGAGQLFPERPVTGSVSYRIRERWPGKCLLRLTHYFGTRGQRTAVLPQDHLPEADQGTLTFAFPPLAGPQEVVPGPDAVFVEFVTLDSGSTVVESNAAVAAVRVAAPDAPRP
jgi:hypothetical protein